MTAAVYDFYPGDTPLLISVPHDGREIPPKMAARMTPQAQQLPDNDWHVVQLYRFAEALGASIIAARYSRYVVDLNRPPDDGALYPGQLSTGICPEKTFAGEPLYKDRGRVGAAEQAERIDAYWRPYHERIAGELEIMKAAHGHALLWDAHSIASRVPTLFDGELPVLNIGTDRSRSCATALESALCRAAALTPYSWVCNGRFSGGYITRNYGDPDAAVHAVQLELAQRGYMDEKSLRYDPASSARLRESLQSLLGVYVQAARSLHAAHHGGAPGET